MKPQWIILILGFGLYVFALIPGILPHRMDVLAMIISGMLIGSLATIGFDLPFHPKKVGRIFLVIGVLVFLAGIVMALFGHVYYLFIVAVPSLGLALLGIQVLKK